MKKVLWLMQNAPHYREGLLRELSKVCDLTVSAVSCKNFNMIEPNNRRGYKYIECQPNQLLSKLGVNILKGEGKIIRKSWDVIICVEDMHYILRYLYFLQWIFQNKGNAKWVWWGHFSGRKNWILLRWLRYILIKFSSGGLTYTEKIKTDMIGWGLDESKLVSINNSEIYQSDVKPLSLAHINGKLNILFVGRPRDIKRVELIISLVERLKFINARLIGPTMSDYLPLIKQKKIENRILISEAKIGQELVEDFAWSHVVVNPGHLGLLVINAARYGRAIVVDRYSRHAPEVVVAEDSNQYFINWNNTDELDNFFQSLLNKESELVQKGLELSKYVKENYTIETMVERIVLSCL